MEKDLPLSKIQCRSSCVSSLPLESQNRSTDQPARRSDGAVRLDGGKTERGSGEEFSGEDPRVVAAPVQGYAAASFRDDA